MLCQVDYLCCPLHVKRVLFLAFMSLVLSRRSYSQFLCQYLPYQDLHGAGFLEGPRILRNFIHGE